MHPVIKIVLFLVFGAAASIGGVTPLAVGALLLVGLYLAGPAASWRQALRMLRRMRWFFLSIVMVYLLFTPGRLLFTAWPWGPTLEGLTEGGHRIASLGLIVLAVNLLLQTTPRPALISAILWCLLPLSWLGLPRERLAVRIALTLDAVDGVRRIYRHQPRQRADVESPPRSLATRLAYIGTTAHRLVAKVIDFAESAPVLPIEVPKPSSPPRLQWLLPVLLAALFSVSSW